VLDIGKEGEGKGIKRKKFFQKLEVKQGGERKVRGKEKKDLKMIVEPCSAWTMGGEGKKRSRVKKRRGYIIYLSSPGRWKGEGRKRKARESRE